MTAISPSFWIKRIIHLPMPQIKPLINGILFRPISNLVEVSTIMHYCTFFKILSPTPILFPSQHADIHTAHEGLPDGVYAVIDVMEFEEFILTVCPRHMRR